MANKDVQYVFRNAHRNFTQEDIDYVSEYCAGIADIMQMKNMTVLRISLKKKIKSNVDFYF